MKNQGVNASLLFRGTSHSREASLFYGESADLFATIIKSELVPGAYTLADLGGNKGEFLSQMLAKLPEYIFESSVIDSNPGIEASLNAQKVEGDVLRNGLKEKSIDIAVVRYSLSWNTFNKQKDFLAEISRICKGIAIIQHQGYGDTQLTEQHKAFSKIFDGSIPELRRSDYFPTNPSQVESWMTGLDIRFKKIQDRKIDGISNLFIEKYKLNEREAQLLKVTLGNLDYLMQTAWVLDFRN